MKINPFVSKETERLTLQYHLELTRERKDELALMELRRALHDIDKMMRDFKAALLNMTPELARQIAPYAGTVTNKAASPDSREQAIRKCLEIVDRYSAQLA